MIIVMQYMKLFAMVKLGETSNIGGNNEISNFEIVNTIGSIMDENLGQDKMHKNILSLLLLWKMRPS